MAIARISPIGLIRDLIDAVPALLYQEKDGTALFGVFFSGLLFCSRLFL